MPVTLSPAALPQHLRSQWSSAWLLHGDETLLQQEARDAIVASARTRGFAERKLWVMEARSDWNALLQEAQTQGLFSDQTLLDVRVPGGKPGKEGGQALQALARFAGDALCVMISLPRADAAMRATTWFEALTQACSTIKADAVERAALPAWIRARLASFRLALPAGEAGEECLAYLVDAFEGNLLGAHQELEKLALLQLAGPNAPTVLDMPTLQANVGVVARFGLQRLSEALWSGQLGALHRVLDGLQAEGEPVVLAAWRIAEDVRVLHQTKLAMARGQSAAMALKQLRIWGPSAQLLERVAGQVSLAKLQRWLPLCAQCDAVVKGLPASNYPSDSWAAVQTLATRIAWGLLPSRGLRRAS